MTVVLLLLLLLLVVVMMVVVMVTVVQVMVIVTVIIVFGRGGEMLTVRGQSMRHRRLQQLTRRRNGQRYRSGNNRCAPAAGTGNHHVAVKVVSAVIRQGFFLTILFA